MTSALRRHFFTLAELARTIRVHGESLGHAQQRAEGIFGAHGNPLYLPARSTVRAMSAGVPGARAPSGPYQADILPACFRPPGENVNTQTLDTETSSSKWMAARIQVLSKANPTLTTSELVAKALDDLCLALTSGRFKPTVATMRDPAARAPMPKASPEISVRMIAQAISQQRGIPLGQAQQMADTIACAQRARNATAGHARPKHAQPSIRDAARALARRNGIPFGNAWIQVDDMLQARKAGTR